MKKYKMSINILVVCIIVLAMVACLVGLFSSGGSGQYEFKSINNEVVKIYGQGLYKNDSIAAVAQGKASDLITIILGIPLLLSSLYLTNKGSFRGKLILTGTLGYFLYTYMSYTFLWMYNSFFIIYVILMSLSLYALILSFMSFEIEKLPSMFSKNLPTKFLGGFQLFVAFAIGMLWLGRISSSIFEGAVPVGLEHYTTLVIQGMDLGVVVPTAVLSGILLIKRKPFGYLLSSTIIIKGVAMLTCISAMIINQAISGISMNIVEVMVFPAFNLLAVICAILLLKGVTHCS
ncbi:MAG: hypothetical protein ABRQ25_09755 [Clostridiaceae bacterium]